MVKGPGGMDRILGLSLLGAGGHQGINVFDPGMSVGELESFARRGHADKGEGSNNEGSTGETRSSTLAHAVMRSNEKKSVAGRTTQVEAKAKGFGGQEIRVGGSTQRWMLRGRRSGLTCSA
ncbi:hypothetical protein HU200_011760 [Digitaria exilis]|uniref:Uncharacterized protein n=1 Tax=Digitaria exilis TaxID=1010633 RepID=A0A835FFT4_9POAL|nr:hypothetical protein HU200_011760 [Digitaria exilis]